MLKGRLSDLEELQFSVGLRQKGPDISALWDAKSYIDGRIGGIRNNGLSLDEARLGSTLVPSSSVPLYKAGWASTVSANIGLEWPLHDRVNLAVEAGLQYQGGLKSDLQTLSAGTALAGTNNTNGRLSGPLRVKAQIPF